jgi:hypothetical protein
VRRCVAIAAAAALVVAGCGGDDDTAPHDVASTARTYLRSFAAGDPATACSLLTLPARRRLVVRVRAVAPARDCPDAIRRVRAAAGPVPMSALRATKVSGVKVDGRRATAVLKSGSGTQTARFTKLGGRWRLAAAPGIQ